MKTWEKVVGVICLLLLAVGMLLNGHPNSLKIFHAVCGALMGMSGFWMIVFLGQEWRGKTLKRLICWNVATAIIFGIAFGLLP